MDDTPERKLTYKRYAIAYMDILGTKEAIKSLNPKDLIRRFNNVFLIGKAIVKNDIFSKNPKSAKVKIFSDNICIAVEINDKKDELIKLAWLAENCRTFQSHVFKNYGNFLIRGGITIGDLYIDDTFVLGPGLIDAYKLESQNAKFPRIIVDERYAEKAMLYLKDACSRINEGKGKCAIIEDDDGVCFLDYLEPNQYGVDKSIDTTYEWIKQDEEILNIILSSATGCPKDKSDWLKKYHQRIKDEYSYKGTSL